MSDLAATSVAQEVMLVARFADKAGKGHPDAVECTPENHGGDIRVNINHHEFVFASAG